MMYDPISEICLRVGYDACDDDEYRAEDGQCKSCHDSCKECVGPEDYHCTDCDDQNLCAKDPTTGEDLTDQCRDVGEHKGVTHSFGRCGCASGFYLGADYECKACHGKCKECIGPGESQCVECRDLADEKYVSTGDAATNTSATSHFVGLTCICDEDSEYNDDGICVTKKSVCDWH